MTQQRRFSRCTGVRRLVSRHSVLLVALMLSASLLSGIPRSALALSFEGEGIVVTDHNEFEQIDDMAIQPDGKIVAVGHSGLFHGSLQLFDIMVARYNIDGSLDATFGSNGIVITDVGASVNVMGVALQGDGKIVIAGGTNPTQGFAVVRYNTDGSLDTGFGFGGIILERSSRSLRIMDLAIQSDGKIVVAGEARIPGSRFVEFASTLARFETDGFPDFSFGIGGISQAVPTGFTVSPILTSNDITLQADQKIVVAGVCRMNSLLQFCLSRYNSNGSLDNTFDGDGLAVADFGFFSNGVAEAVRVRPDGKIVATGQASSNFESFPALARFNTDGSPDASFGNAGTVITFNSFQFRATALALRSDGKIVIAGEGFVSNPFTHSVMTVARYNSNGVIDDTFNGGIVTTFVGTVHSAATTVAVQADGRIVAGGFGNFTIGEEATFSDFALVRYDTPINNPPIVQIIGPASGSAFAVNTPVNFTGVFSDDPGDTHVVEWIFESLTQPVTIVLPVPGAASGSADTTHTFTEAGVYKVALRVTDNTFLSSTATTVFGLDALVVIFDPNGGWVRGGGWIASPQGAFTPMPTATGRINFGFVTKYQNGASVPNGKTQFHFNAGNLNFESTSYEWLVISGNKAQCRGAGTINGIGGFQFSLTSIDGNQPGGADDKLRIRIWDNTSVIYDNQFNAPESDDPTTVLGGGNIVIQH